MLYTTEKELQSLESKGASSTGSYLLNDTFYIAEPVRPPLSMILPSWTNAFQVRSQLFERSMLYCNVTISVHTYKHPPLGREYSVA